MKDDVEMRCPTLVDTRPLAKMPSGACTSSLYIGWGQGTYCLAYFMLPSSAEKERFVGVVYTVDGPNEHEGSKETSLLGWLSENYPKVFWKEIGVSSVTEHLTQFIRAQEQDIELRPISLKLGSLFVKEGKEERARASVFVDKASKSPEANFHTFREIMGIPECFESKNSFDDIFEITPSLTSKVHWFTLSSMDSCDLKSLFNLEYDWNPPVSKSMDIPILKRSESPLRRAESLHMSKSMEIPILRRAESPLRRTPTGQSISPGSSLFHSDDSQEKKRRLTFADDEPTRDLSSLHALVIYSEGSQPLSLDLPRTPLDRCPIVVVVQRQQGTTCYHLEFYYNTKNFPNSQFLKIPPSLVEEEDVRDVILRNINNACSSIQDACVAKMKSQRADFLKGFAHQFDEAWASAIVASNGGASAAGRRRSQSESTKGMTKKSSVRSLSRGPSEKDLCRQDSSEDGCSEDSGTRTPEKVPKTKPRTILGINRKVRLTESSDCVAMSPIHEYGSLSPPQDGSRFLKNFRGSLGKRTKSQQSSISSDDPSFGPTISFDSSSGLSTPRSSRGSSTEEYERATFHLRCNNKLFPHIGEDPECGDDDYEYGLLSFRNVHAPKRLLKEPVSDASVIPDATLKLEAGKSHHYELLNHCPIYERRFANSEHFLFFMYSDGNFSIIAVKPRSLHEEDNGLLIMASGWEEFFVPQVTKHKIKRHLEAKYGTGNIISVKNPETVIDDIVSLDNEFSLKVKRLSIGVICWSAGQTSPLHMVQDPSLSKSSESYKEFWKAIGVPEMFDEDNVFNDVFNGTEIKWYLSDHLSGEEKRKFIGNVNCVIIFKECEEPINPAILTELGKVNQFYIIVERAHDNKTIKPSPLKRKVTRNIEVLTIPKSQGSLAPYASSPSIQMKKKTDFAQESPVISSSSLSSIPIIPTGSPIKGSETMNRRLSLRLPSNLTFSSDSYGVGTTSSPPTPNASACQSHAYSYTLAPSPSESFHNAMRKRKSLGEADKRCLTRNRSKKIGSKTPTRKHHSENSSDDENDHTTEENAPSYRIACCQRKTMKVFQPQVPEGYVFSVRAARDFILTKAHNGFVTLRTGSELSFLLFCCPRMDRLANIVMSSEKDWALKKQQEG
eukprot:TRINITY_DN9571_c0_g1_i3.p1 TRINITY_DN9571_c0_g1~~TRINITY_DN9571_c0_g1_i3.p1  ORF type:complete len:1157 (+),score=190.07 TRINITY_DN9571_c0_g1_i3:103-3471(+)